MSWWCLIAGQDDASYSSLCWSPSTDSLNQFRRLPLLGCLLEASWLTALCYTSVPDHSHKPTCLKCAGLNLFRTILEMTVDAMTVRIRAATTNSEPPVIAPARLRCPGNRWQERGGWLWLTRSMVLALTLEASSHQVSHHSHSCGRDLMATWWIMLLGRS